MQELRLKFLLSLRSASNDQSGASMGGMRVPSFGPHLKRARAAAGA